MGTTDFGSQKIQVNFNAPADSVSWGKRQIDIVPRGILRGGLLTRVNDTTVTLSPLVVEIGDDFYQVRVATTTSVVVTVASATPYVVLRWVYTGAVNNYMDVLAVDSGSVQANDIIIGKCVFVWTTLTGINYGDSTWPRTYSILPHIMLRVEAQSVPDMTVVIRAGRVNYKVSNLLVDEQVSSAFVAPVSNPRIDVVYVDTDGLVKIYTGTEALVPVAPVYNSKKVLAEISLSVGMSTIVDTNIRDVRSFI